MNRVFSVSALDRAGAFLSSACALHCLLLPLFTASASVGAFAALASERAEAAFLSAAVLMAVFVLGRGWADHRRASPLGLFVLGLVPIGVGRFLVSEACETLLVVAGSLMFAAAHLLNSRACGDARCLGPCVRTPCDAD